MSAKSLPLLLATLSAAAPLLGATTAFAQTPGSAATLDEIVVLARKRSESIQEVPVAVTAVSASQIQAMDLQGLEDISKLTAGLVFDNEFGRDSNRPVIRGQANILGDSGVSYFIDGVYIEGSIADYDLNDVERIEIVKGPQSALYGRNTYSGAINIITKSPGDAPSADVRVTASEDGELEISAAVRGPLLDDRLSGGLAYRRYELDGAWTNEFDGSDIGVQESESVSGVLAFTPTDSLNVRLRAYYNSLDDGQPALFHQSALDNNCFADNGSLYNGLGRYYCGTIMPGSVNTDYSLQVPGARDEVESLQTSLSINYDINDAWSFTSISGYNKEDDLSLTDGDYQPTRFQTANFTPNLFPAPFISPVAFAFAGSVVDFTFAGFQEYQDFSQELRFQFEGDRFSALFGAYYLDAQSDSWDVRTLPPGAQDTIDANLDAETARLQTDVCGPNPGCFFVVPFVGPLDVPRDRSETDIENIALFGLVEFQVSDAVGVTLEARYQEEKISRLGVIQNLGGPVELEVNASETFSSFSPRGTVQWDLSDDNMLYGVIATGTKPGGFNGTVAIEAGVPTFEEEDVTSFELGSKNVFADGSVTANFALFFNQIEGYQLTQNVRSGANTQSATVNAGDADIFGFEAEVAARPSSVDGLTLTFNYAYTDSEFTKGFDQNQGVLDDVADDGLVNCSLGFALPEFMGQNCSTNAGASNNPPAFGSIAGNQIPRTAEHQVYADVELRRGLGQGDWEWFVGANVQYESSKYSQVHNLIETGDTTLVNARLGFVNDRYTINVFGRNLTGEDASPLVLRYADAAQAFRRSFVGTLRRDTYFGVTAAVSFGR